MRHCIKVGIGHYTYLTLDSRACWMCQGCHRQSAIQLGVYSGYNRSWKRELRFWDFLGPVRPWMFPAGLDKWIMVLCVFLCRVLTEGSG